MTPFSTLAREYPTADSTLTAREEAVLGTPQKALTDPHFETLRQPLEVAGLEENFLPSVVLQLPDLKAHTPWRPSALIPSARHLYWVLLALGALFAVWLIASGKKPASAPRDEAPTWTNQGSMQNGGAAADGDATSGPLQWRASTQAPAVEQSQAPSATQVEQPIAPVDGQAWENFPAPANPPATGESPPVDGASNGQSPPNIRTARAADETRWDGNSGGIKPSEARPLGITTGAP